MLDHEVYERRISRIAAKGALLSPLGKRHDPRPEPERLRNEAEEAECRGLLEEQNSKVLGVLDAGPGAGGTGGVAAGGQGRCVGAGERPLLVA